MWEIDFFRRAVIAHFTFCQVLINLFQRVFHWWRLGCPKVYFFFLLFFISSPQSLHKFQSQYEIFLFYNFLQIEPYPLWIPQWSNMDSPPSSKTLYPARTQKFHYQTRLNKSGSSVGPCLMLSHCYL